MRWSLSLIVVAAGCGRIDFDPLGNTGDGSTSDVGADACTFGAFSTPVALTELNTNGDDWGPWLSPDQLEIVFSSDVGAAMGNSDLYRATRATPAVAFGAPMPISELNTAGNEDDPFLSDDGLTIFYTGVDASTHTHVRVATRAARGQPFGAPTTIPELESATADEGTPDLDPTLTTIIFSSTRASGNFDLYRATRASPLDTFSTPQLLNALDSNAYDCCAASFADHSGLLFVSDFAVANVYKIYSANTAGTTFTAPALYAQTLSAGAINDTDPFWSRDGTTIVFASTRPGGMGLHDLYITQRGCL